MNEPSHDDDSTRAKAHEEPTVSHVAADPPKMVAGHELRGELRAAGWASSTSRFIRSSAT